MVVLVAASARADDAIVVPGGQAAVERLLGFSASGPDEFVSRLNRTLLSETHPDHAWEQLEKRVKLVTYLEEVAELEKRFSPRIAVGIEPKPRKTFERLAEAVGYKLRLKAKVFALVPKEGEEWARRRELAQALGWDLAAAARELAPGHGAVLEIGRSEVSAPLPLDRWRSLSGKRVTAETALLELAKDQRLGLVMAGLERVTSETAATLEKLGLLPWVYEHAPRPFFRYAYAIRIHEGALVLPGGAESADLWRELVGESPRQVRSFIEALLARRDAKAAYLWQSLATVPHEVAGFYLGVRGDLADDRRYAKRVLARLDNVAADDFSGTLGGDLGFGVLVRSLPLAPAARRLALPGGAGLWWVAIRSEDTPDDAASLAKVVARARTESMDDGELLQRVLDEAVKVRGYHRPALPRLIRGVHLFGDREDLLTPANVVLVTRASDAQPAALAVLDDVELASPDAASDYLLTVAALARLPRSVESELLLTNFQGGVEWLHVMARADHAPALALEKHLTDWSRIHRTASDPYQVAERELAWTESLLRALPPAEEGAPGRGPLERAMLQALVARGEPQTFMVAGAQYRSERGIELRRELAARLVAQGIPAADDLVALRSGLAELRAACAGGEVARAHAAARQVESAMARFPRFDLRAVAEDRILAARVLPVDRPRLIALVRDVLARDRPRRIESAAGEVGRASGLLARELRPFLLAPAYLAAIAGSRSVLFDSPNLIRNHLLYEQLERDVATDSPWIEGRLETKGVAGLGAGYVGHLSGVPRALAEYALPDTGSRTHSSDVERLRLSFEDLVTTPWQRLGPEVTGTIAATIAAGDLIVARAVAELPTGGPHLVLAAARVPYARLESEAARPAGSPSRVSLAERLGLGLDFVAEQPQPAVALSAELRRELDQRIASLGPGWRGRLYAASTATPHVNGRTRRWIGSWPSYETLERERLPTALLERQALDLKLAVVRYLGAKGLPGDVGADLLARLLRRIDLLSEAETRGWETALAWTNQLGDADFEEAFRECLQDGLYSVQF